MNFGELKALFRARVDDLSSPYLWSDDDFAGYLDDTINDACERAFLIEDSTTPTVVKIGVTAAKHTYSIDPSIIRIERAKLDLASSKLAITDRETLDGGADWDDLTGTPTRLLDLGASIRLVRIPIIADTLRLVVKRRPLAILTNDTDEPEIPVVYHQRLIPGVIARAYMKNDSESYNKAASDQAEIEFSRWFGAKRDANVMRKHREHRSHTTRCNW